MSEKAHSSGLFLAMFQNKDLYKSLAEIDPEVQNIVDKETWRQFSGLELIASEVCVSNIDVGMCMLF